MPADGEFDAVDAFTCGGDTPVVFGVARDTPKMLMRQVAVYRVFC
jgi:hypothetical protein